MPRKRHHLQAIACRSKVVRSNKVALHRTTVCCAPLHYIHVPHRSRQHTGPSVPWAIIGPAPLQQFKVSLTRSTGACHHVPWTPIGSAPAEHVELPPLGGFRTSCCVPRTPVSSAPLEQFKVSPRGRPCTRPFVPRAPIFAAPHQGLEVPSQGSSGTRHLVPYAVVCPAPLEHLQMSSLCSTCAGVLIPRAAVGPTPLQYLQMPTCGSGCACFGVPATASCSPGPLEGFQVPAGCRRGTCTAEERVPAVHSPLQTRGRLYHTARSSHRHSIAPRHPPHIRHPGQEQVVAVAGERHHVVEHVGTVDQRVPTLPNVLWRANTTNTADPPILLTDGHGSTLDPASSDHVDSSTGNLQRWEIKETRNRKRV